MRTNGEIVTADDKEVATFEVHGLPSAETLRYLRELARLTQGDVARAIGVGQSRISAIEKGVDQAKVSTIRKYVEAVGGEFVLRAEVRMPFAETLGALQRIAAAVSNYNREEYLAAVKYAREIGCTEEQIEDAYDYRSGLMKSGPSFDREGQPR